MKTYNKLILSMLGSAFVVGAVSAQTWTLNGATQPSQLTTSSNESAVAIDPLTGIASVKTAGVGPSVAISANPGSVDINTATTITWTASNFGNNLSCTRTSSPTLSDWNGLSTQATGSVSVTMPSSPQTVSLTLSCSGVNGLNSNFTNVVVLQPGTGPDCSMRPPGYNSGSPTGASPRSLISRTYASLFNSAFPGPVGDRWEGQPNGVGDGAVIAFQFVAPTTPQNGYLEMADSPDRGGFGVLTAGFSECPGYVAQFKPGSTTELDPCWGGQVKSQSRWTINPSQTSLCLLIPGRTYYWNVTVADRCLSSNSQPASCGLRMEVR